MATVGEHDSGPNPPGDWTTSFIIMDDGSEGKSVWTLFGKGNKRPETKYEWDAVSDVLVG